MKSPAFYQARVEQDIDLLDTEAQSFETSYTHFVALDRDELKAFLDSTFDDKVKVIYPTLETKTLHKGAKLIPVDDWLKGVAYQEEFQNVEEME
mgnify:FL=1